MMIHRRKIFVYRALVGLRMFLGVNSTVLGFQDPKTQSFVIRGSSLVASAPMGSSLVDERLEPLCSKPKKYSVQQQLQTSYFQLQKITLTSQKCLSTQNHLKTSDFKLKSSFSLTLKLTLFLFHFSHLKLSFFLRISSLFFLLFFPLIFF